MRRAGHNPGQKEEKQMKKIRDLNRLTQDQNVLFEIEEILNSLESHSNVKIDSAFCAINNLLGTFGVEAIRLPDTWHRYWGDAIYIYIGMGDLDSPTLFYSVSENKIFIDCLENVLAKIEERKN
jgi:hypothetical protein